MAAPSAMSADAGAPEGAERASASMQCDRAIEPGRVKCSVDVHTLGGFTLGWADVQLVELPEFTSALKGRLGPSDATLRESTSQRWAFGLVARRPGQGEAHAKVRLLACAPDVVDGGSTSSWRSRGGSPRCVPLALDVKATVHVGS